MAELVSAAEGWWLFHPPLIRTTLTDGALPLARLAIDPAGVPCGTTELGGSYGYSNVYKLKITNGTWMETILHGFRDGSDGEVPYPGAILDQQGNLYGTASGGAYGFGVVFEITP